MMIIIELIMNACIAFTGFYVISKVHHSTFFYLRQHRNIIVGILGGLLGLFLMISGVELSHAIRIDLRYLPLLLLASYGARLPLIISTIIIASTRFLFGFNEQALVAFIATFVMSSGMIWLHHRFLNRMYLQSMMLNIWALFVISIAVLINMGWGLDYVTLLSSIWLVGLLVGFLSSVLSVDLETSTLRLFEYKYSSERDHLTGLFNRRMWERYTNTLGMDDRPYNILVLDIDYFKKINDQYGHANGDLVLKQFANLLKRETRRHDVVARIGGEEFIILMYDLTPDLIERVANRIRENVLKEVFNLKDNIAITITVSIGVAHGHSRSINILSAKADEALYVAKNSGRNQVVISS